ncbi:MAG: DUF421 domain-containing protein [Oscillospiraceae bacterium]
MFIALFRTVVLYLLIILGIRLMGKRQVGELEPSELVFTLLIADLAAVPMQDFGIPLSRGVIPIIALLCVTLLLSIFTVKSIRFRAFICGRPSIVIKDGKLCQQEMLKNRFTLDELSEELRVQGYSDISKVKYAILETNGQLTVLLNAEEQPVTAAQMGLTPKEPGLPAIIISDGRLLEDNLKKRGLDDKWLEKQLEHNHVRRVKDVFILSVDEQGTVFFAEKEKKR